MLTYTLILALWFSPSDWTLVELSAYESLESCMEAGQVFGESYRNVLAAGCRFDGVVM